jgi:hypothetical protein
VPFGGGDRAGCIRALGAYDEALALESEADAGAGGRVIVGDED